SALILRRPLAWSARLRYALLYGVTVVALAAPYLLFIEMNGGIRMYTRTALAWAERDRDRAEVVWPGLFENPDGVSQEAASGNPVRRAIAVVRDNSTAWMFYAEIALPFVAILLLTASPDAFRPDWPNARAKLGTVAVLAAVLDAGFLRSPLAAR